MNKKNIMYVLLVLGLSGGALPSASAADKVKPSAEVEAKLAKVIKDAHETERSNCLHGLLGLLGLDRNVSVLSR